MTSRILVYAHNAISIISDIEKEWTKRNLSICKTADFKEVIKELRYHNYLLIVVSLSNEANLSALSPYTTTTVFS